MRLPASERRGTGRLVPRATRLTRLPIHGRAEIFSFTLPRFREPSGTLAASGKQLRRHRLVRLHQPTRHARTSGQTQDPARAILHRLKRCGNTVFLDHPYHPSRSRPRPDPASRSLVMLVGFGVGYSWAPTLVRWSERAALRTLKLLALRMLRVTGVSTRGARIAWRQRVCSSSAITASLWRRASLDPAFTFLEICSTADWMFSARQPGQRFVRLGEALDSLAKGFPAYPSARCDHVRDGLRTTFYRQACPLAGSIPAFRQHG